MAVNTALSAALGEAGSLAARPTCWTASPGDGNGRLQMLTFFLLLAKPEKILALTTSVVSTYVE
jgi:hypothetical protein